MFNLNMVGYTDIIMIGGITAIAVYLWVSSKTKQTTTMVDLKKLKVLPSNVEDNSGAKGASSEKGLIEKMKSSGKTIVIFFGSQTGTGEEFAQRLAKNCRLYGLKALVVDPEEIDLEDLQRLNEIENSIAIFIMATYGEGDPTDNAQELYDYLQRGEWDLKGLKYGVFGLGNKTYEHYNEIGKYFDKRLEELNGSRLIPLGLGDDDVNIEEDFVTWMDKFWPIVCEYYGISASEQDISMRQYKLLNIDDVPEEKIFKGEVHRLNSYNRQKPPFDTKNPFMAPISVKYNLFKGTDRKCLHIELDITGSRLRYEAGDHVAVYPANDAELVDKIGKLLNVDLDQTFSLINIEEDATKKHPFPCPTTFRTALTYYLDITSLPTTQLLKELAQYANDENEKKSLQLMASASEEGKAHYNSFIRDEHTDLVNLLEKMTSLKPPIDHVMELLPRLQARYYSISSSPKVHPNTIHITCTVVEYETKDGRQCKGVTTNWLLNKPVLDDLKSKVPIFVRKSQFRLPFKFQTSVIMIGPGTGLAPFRGFLQERDYYRKEGRLVGKSLLYYGCRKRTEDYLYQEELEEYEKNGTLTKLNVAFSRDQAEKVYVTHLLRKDSNLLWNIIKEGGHIYVCGDAKNMARDVHDLLIDLCEKEGGMGKTQAVQYVKDLGQKSRYVLDVWS
ncbi:unnamed protein product [Brachionus calyciflorus]|uniref:NADPH--cytochrome P450 reductase n=1 Tax=Brachionus calyciflorus TaxID=104777 RepID=A0A814EMW1_9BILA|nr:unnamed protein product [Brachionus calyciflorus]